MKKNFCVLLIGFYISGVCIAQEREDVLHEQESHQENKWKGIIRFNPSDLFINLHNALPGVSITWIPYYILPNLGIPAEININFGWGVLPGVEISLLTGAEYILIGPPGKDKNGLYLDFKMGFSLFFHEGVKAAFIARANAGYQLVTKKGFVFTPAVGCVFSSRCGFGLNIMLDIGFAYR